MSFALRKRNLSCFYCGSRSVQKYDGFLRQFQCPRCEAVNYLDAKGDITDPPVAAEVHISRGVRYASPEKRAASPQHSGTDNIFCDECLKNQHLLAQNLASYLPPEDDPEYSQYVAAYNTYKSKLEQRYPQVCAECAPRARERIRHAAYVAKTDYLKRMVARTRSIGIQHDSSRVWRSLIFTLGALGWWLSALFQLAWHASASMSLRDSSRYGDINSLTRPQATLVQSVKRVISYGQIHVGCGLAITPLMPGILLMATFSSWWNNCLRKKYLRTGGRMVNLIDYYILQLITLGARTAAWIYLLDLESSGLVRSQGQAAHTFMALFIAFSTLFSSRIVKLDTKPRFSFYTDDSQILPDIPSRQQAGGKTTAAQGISKREDKGAGLLTPASSSLSNASQHQLWQESLPRGLEYSPLTPPPEEDRYDPDAMDWTPSKPSPRFHTAPTPLSQKALHSQPATSPFYGSLPLAPRPPAFEVRQPAHMKQKRTPQISSPRQTINPFTSPVGTGSFSARQQPDDVSLSTNTSASDSEQDPDDLDRAGPTPRKRKGRRSAANTPIVATGRGEFAIAPARLTLKEDVVDTGLENMFDEVFSIEDAPKGVRARGGDNGRTRQGWFWGGNTGSDDVNRTETLASGQTHIQGSDGQGFGSGSGSGYTRQTLLQQQYHRQQQMQRGVGEAAHGATGAAQGSSSGSGWTGVAMAGVTPIAILGVAVMIVKNMQ